MDDRRTVRRVTGVDPPAPTAQRVTVVTDEGNRYPGWVILDDVVLVRGLRRTDFCPSVRVEHDGRVLPVRDLVDSRPTASRGRSGVALVLDTGSFHVMAEATPPNSDPGEWRAEFPTLVPTPRGIRWSG